MNICMVGYGMMGVWHSEALQRTDATLHTVIGRRAEAARLRADRLEGLVEMSATLAHEIRNPLMGLSAQAEFCRLGDSGEADEQESGDNCPGASHCSTPLLKPPSQAMSSVHDLPYPTAVVEERPGRRSTSC